MHVGAIPLFVSRDRHLEVGNAARDPGQDPFRRMGVLDAGELAQSDRVCPRFFAAQKGSEPEGAPYSDERREGGGVTNSDLARVRSALSGRLALTIGNG